MKALVFALAFVAAAGFAKADEVTDSAQASSATLPSEPVLVMTPEAQASAASLQDIADDTAPAMVKVPGQSVMFAAPAAGTSFADVKVGASEANTHTEQFIDPMGNGNFQRVTSTNTMRLKSYSFRLAHGLSESSSFIFDAGFVQIENEVGKTRTSKQGMRDFALAYERKSIRESGNINYGISLTGSPQTFNRVKAEESTFSGGSVARIHAGYEAHLARAMAGLDLGVAYELVDRKATAFEQVMGNSTPTTIDAVAFYEFPIVKKVDFGVSAGVASSEKFANVNSDIMYEGSAYTQLRVLDDTAMTFMLRGMANATSDYSANRDGAELTAGLRKAL